MKYHHLSMLPEDAFQHCGNGKIRLHGDAENFFQNPLGTIEDALGSLDDWVHEEIPGGWMLPVAVVATIYGGPAAGEGVMEAGGTTAAAGTAAASSSYIAAQQVALQALVDLGIPFNTAVGLTSVSGLATTAAINAAMQLATTGKIDVGSMAKSMLVGGVSSVVGGVVADSIDNKLLSSIASSAAQGATGAAIRGGNPLTAALASGLAGGVGYATQSSGIQQASINQAINSLASGQSIKDALISSVFAAGGAALRPYVKEYFDQIGAGDVFNQKVAAEENKTNFLNDPSKQELFKKVEADVDFLNSAASKALTNEYTPIAENLKGNMEAYGWLTDPYKFIAEMGGGMQYNPETDELWWPAETKSGKLIFDTWANQSAQASITLPFVIKYANENIAKLNDLNSRGMDKIIAASNEVTGLNDQYAAITKQIADADSGLNSVDPQKFYNAIFTSVADNSSPSGYYIKDTNVPSNQDGSIYTGLPSTGSGTNVAGLDTGTKTDAGNYYLYGSSDIPQSPLYKDLRSAQLDMGNNNLTTDSLGNIRDENGNIVGEVKMVPAPDNVVPTPYSGLSGVVAAGYDDYQNLIYKTPDGKFVDSSGNSVSAPVTGLNGTSDSPTRGGLSGASVNNEGGLPSSGGNPNPSVQVLPEVVTTPDDEEPTPPPENDWEPYVNPPEPNAPPTTAAVTPSVTTTAGGSTASGGLPTTPTAGVSGTLPDVSKLLAEDTTKYPSPIKPYLQPNFITTGTPAQSSLYTGLDPKLVNILSGGMANGGQVHPQLQRILADRGYEMNPVEMVAGPEDRYYARHAKRGFAVNGEGTGQSDDIPTMLADGEYVFDADTVAALGDGSSKAGAAALDKMREEIRKHKRSAPVDKIPPKAKSPLDYLKMVRKGNKHG